MKDFSTKMQQTQFRFLIIILFFITSIKAQQEYSGNEVLDCDDQGRKIPPSPSYLYTCNGLSLSCQAFLIFKSQPDYNSITTISRLFSSNPSELARINNISGSYIFSINKEVIVPVNCSCSVFLWLRKRNKKRIKRKKPYDLSKDIITAVSRIDRVLKVFQVEELEVATKDFSSECRIQGSVYRGTVGKNMFAIKKMSRDASQEAKILHKLNHFNLISLCGIGRGRKHFYLVYEYMENGSLKDWLQDPSHFGRWKWTQRVQIALDIANGLDYLHNFTYPPYVHRDIKSSNVLLSGKFRAKITNFSLARSSDRMLTKNVEGTLGYMAPEYIESGIVTPKLDVYAFGVVMSELITGKDVINEYKGRKELLPYTIVDIMEGRNAEKELVDFMESNMRSISPIGLVMEVAKLCVACLTKDPERRLNMRAVVSNLSRIQRDSQMWALAYQ